MDHDPQYATPDGTALRIWQDVAKNNFLSEREGRPVFDEVVYVEVIAPGSGGASPVFEAIRFWAKELGQPPRRTAHYEKYKTFVDQFLSNEEAGKLSGTPLSEWPEISRSLAATLKAAGIHTVEALANIGDTRLTLVGPDGRTWREKANAFLEAAKDASYATGLAADVQHLREELADKNRQVEELAAQVAALQATVRAATTDDAPGTPTTGLAGQPDTPVPAENVPPAASGDDLVPAGKTTKATKAPAASII